MTKCTRNHITVSPLHITNGDCAANTLRTFLTDRVLVTCDVLHDGPAPAVDGDAWYETRARFLTDAFEAAYDETRSSLARFDRMLADAPPDQEIVLWFEHDLFDQLLLIRTLDVLVRLKPDATYRSDGSQDKSETNSDDSQDKGETNVAAGFSRTNVSLICIDRFPGVERFVGLGQLSAEQLASLYPARQAVSAAQFARAREAWRAFRADDPRKLLALMVRLDATDDTNPSPVASGFSRTNGAPLPFLYGAIHRLFEEYPSTANGLSRSAGAVLRALESGPLDGMTLFRATQSHEERPFMGDLGLFGIVHGLSVARVPLVTIEQAGPSPDLRTATMRLTNAGGDVLAGRQDAVVLNGIDEWKGGVHLLGADRSPWRWDNRGKTLVS